LLENYILSLKPIGPADIPADAMVAVLEYDYRPAPFTTHRRQVDFVYSRTGVSRVGEEPPVWDGPNRCWLSVALSHDLGTHYQATLDTGGHEAELFEGSIADGFSTATVEGLPRSRTGWLDTSSIPLSGTTLPRVHRSCHGACGRLAPRDNPSPKPRNPGKSAAFSDKNPGVA